MRELDSDNGIGLIEKKRRGLGRPDIIYVKNFASSPDRTMGEKSTSVDGSTEVKDFDFKEQKNLISGSKESELQEVNNLAPNYTNSNQNNMSYINQINQSKEKREDVMEDVGTYIELVKKNIEFEHHMKYDNRQYKELYEELFEVICEIVCVKRATIRIAGEDYPYELVKSKFLKLNSAHLEYVIERMHGTNTKITNIKSYMVTALYNAPMTMNHYYQQDVQHDMYGGGG